MECRCELAEFVATTQSEICLVIALGEPVRAADQCTDCGGLTICEQDYDGGNEQHGDEDQQQRMAKAAP